MCKRAILLLLALAGFGMAAAPGKQPVFVILYSRFYDHGHQHSTDERLQRMLPLLERFHAAYPQSGISALLQFSGTVSELLDEENAGLHLVDKLKDYSGRGLVDLGYTGEEEPSYIYRPKPSLLLANTPEERWAAKAEAAHRFLTDYKNPVSGYPVAGLSGGLKRTQEIFGKASFVTGVSTTLGGDSAAVNETRRLNPGALLSGIPTTDPRRGIEGFGFSAEGFSKSISPDTFNSPEVFWQDNVLRISDTSFTDNKPHSTEESLDELKKAFAKLDRNHVRVIKLEIASYRRYLQRRPDGSLIADPVEWMYYHPDDPVMPLTMKGLVTQTEIEAGFKRDETILKWLAEEYMPANPGSRFLSVRELAKMAVVSPEVTAAQMKALASDIDEKFNTLPMEPPDFARAGNVCFSLAESFDLFARALAASDKTGSFPKSLQVHPVYGPFTLPLDMGATTGALPVSAVIKAAATIAPKLSNAELKRIPDNAVPALISVGPLHLNASQMLRLMAQAYLDPTTERILKVNAITLTTRASFLFPKNTPMTDQGNAWTIKPAPLQIDSSAVATASVR